MAHRPFIQLFEALPLELLPGPSALWNTHEFERLRVGDKSLRLTPANPATLNRLDNDPKQWLRSWVWRFNIRHKFLYHITVRRERRAFPCAPERSADHGPPPQQVSKENLS